MINLSSVKSVISAFNRQNGRKTRFITFCRTELKQGENSRLSALILRYSQIFNGKNDEERS